MKMIGDVVRVVIVAFAGLMASIVDYSRVIDVNEAMQSVIQTAIALATLAYILRKLWNQNSEIEANESQS